MVKMLTKIELALQVKKVYSFKEKINEKNFLKCMKNDFLQISLEGT